MTLQEQRANLPIAVYRQAIVDAIKTYQVNFF